MRSAVAVVLNGCFTARTLVAFALAGAILSVFVAIDKRGSRSPVSPNQARDGAGDDALHVRALHPLWNAR